jgi:hypothetical protein
MDPAEIVFDVREDEGGSGYLCAKAQGYPIFTQGRDWQELKEMVKEAVLCFFDADQTPAHVRLRFLKDEVMAV